MKLVWRRAVEARGLLLAAAIAALVAVALVTGLSDYNRRAVDAGQRALLAAAPAEERSLLVSGSGGRDAEEYADRDRAVRAQFTDGLGGVPVTVDGRNLFELCDLSIRNAAEALDALQLSERDQMIAEREAAGLKL